MSSDVFSAALAELKAIPKPSANFGIVSDAAHALLVKFPKESLKQKVLEYLWRFHHDSISTKEKALAEAAASPGDVVALEGARSAFDEAINKATIHLQSLYQRLAHLANTSYGRVLLYTVLVFTGDVYRYEARNAPAAERTLSDEHERLSKSSAISQKKFQSAFATYVAAWRLRPSCGAASNQIGLLYLHRGEYMLASYFFIRSVFASEKPFPKAWGNFLGLLERPPSVMTSASLVLETPLHRVDKAFLCLMDGLLHHTHSSFEAEVELLVGAVSDYVTDSSQCCRADMILERITLSLVMLLCWQQESPNPQQGATVLRSLLTLLTGWSNIVVQTSLTHMLSPQQRVAMKSILPDGLEGVIASVEIFVRWMTVVRGLATGTGRLCKACMEGSTLDSTLDGLFATFVAVVGDLVAIHTDECTEPPAQVELQEDKELAGLAIVRGDSGSPAVLLLRVWSQTFADGAFGVEVCNKLRRWRLRNLMQPLAHSVLSGGVRNGIEPAVGVSPMFNDDDDDEDDVVVLSSPLEELHCPSTPFW